MRFHYSTNLTLLSDGGKGVSYVKEKNFSFLGKKKAVLFTDEYTLLFKNGNSRMVGVFWQRFFGGGCETF